RAAARKKEPPWPPATPPAAPAGRGPGRNPVAAAQRGCRSAARAAALADHFSAQRFGNSWGVRRRVLSSQRLDLAPPFFQALLDLLFRPLLRRLVKSAGR